ncbi:CIC11C00000003805 [Sungouiella intermedia]|uniref:CIC11C00000003805 n=1 Tax=Sungouiella intermedia TaxID=45354 RepID=A0A1L0C0U6_9ASCO|nr:CIC11C00000003805 [[Candida] intermedia]
MPYPNPLKIVTQKLTDNILLAASGFKRFDKINFGGRMALFHYNNSVIVWSAMPFGDEVHKAIEKLTGQSSSPVAYLIIPDTEHTIAAKLFKAKYPELKIISVELVDLGPETPIDYVVTSKYSKKLIDKQVLQEIGITDPTITDHFEFVYLPDHANKELVIEELGFPKNYFPFSGYSFLARYLNPDSSIGNKILNKIANSTASAEGLRIIYGWDFDKIVMCHGNVIKSNAKNEFKKVFGKVL